MTSNSRPYMAALESQLDALHLVQLLLRDAPPAVRDLKSWRVDERLLQTASPFAWSDDVVQAVMKAGESIPLDTPMNKWNLETEAAWWHFERPLPLKTVLNDKMGVRALCFGWVKTQVPDFGMPVCVWTDGDTTSRFWSGHVSPSQTFEWAVGETLGEMLESTRKDHVARYGPSGPDKDEPQIGIEDFMRATEAIARFVLAGIAWLGQKVLVAEQAHVERHRRKEFTKRTGREPLMRVVQLRRASYHPTPTDDEGTPVNWSCQWVVGGHWRNQACGLKHGDRKLTWIPPYVKGPEDKPMKTSPMKAYEVSR